MESALMKTPDRKPIEKLHVVRNFSAVIEARDISLMKDELYQFLTLHCGFRLVRQGNCPVCPSCGWSRC